MGTILNFSTSAPQVRRLPIQRRGEPGFMSLDVFDGSEFLGCITIDREHGDFAAWSADRASIVPCPNMEAALATVRAMAERGQ